MTGPARRVGAVLWSDFLVRYRKPSTVVVFLLLCFSAYLWVPDPSSGYALISVQGQRVLYDSPALAFATGVLFSLLITLFGFYIVKGSIDLDVRSRCGLVIASTPTTNWQYLLGKCLGNILFLTTLAAGYLLSSMVMQVVRGEAPLDPIPFLILYAVLVPPGIVFVSAAAVFFESTPRLAGRGGEVLYFFLWALLLGVSIAWHTQGANLGLFLDFTGVGILEQMLRDTMGSEGVSIGAAPFDSTIEPLVLAETQVKRSWILPRIVSTLAPAVLLLPAAALFHRFDPSRSRLSRRRQGPGLTDRLASLARRPASLAFSRLAPRLGSQRSLIGAVVSEALLILLLHPLGAVSLGLLTVVALILPLSVLAQIVLPAIFAILAMMLAGASTREHRSGTIALIASIPRLERHYLWWKLGATILVGFVFVGIAALKLSFVDPESALSVVIGLFVTATAATALGILAGTPRAFVVLYLSFWYVVLNDGGRSALLDFAGFFGTATSTTRILYLSLAILLLVVSLAVYNLRRRPGSGRI